MKEFKVLVFMIASIYLLSACGGSKQVTKSQSSISQEMLQDLDKCEKYALMKPEVRAVGEAVDFQISVAKTYAEAQARAELRRKIEDAIKSASGQDNASYQKSASNGQAGASVADAGYKRNSYVNEIAEGVVKNTAIVEMSRYIRQDGAYHIYVCIEYLDGVSNMTENITKQVEQLISDEDRMKMNFEFNKFRERVAEELKKNQNKK